MFTSLKTPIVKNVDFCLTPSHSIYFSLTDLQGSPFRDCSQLQQLSLASNKLTSIDKDSFLGLSSLVDCDLSNNLLSYLPDNMFNSLSHLESLNISVNKLKQIKASGMHCTTLLFILQQSHHYGDPAGLDTCFLPPVTVSMEHHEQASIELHLIVRLVFVWARIRAWEAHSHNPRVVAIPVLMHWVSMVRTGRVGSGSNRKCDQLPRFHSVPGWSRLLPVRSKFSAEYSLPLRRLTKRFL